MQEHERIEALKQMAALRGNRWLSIGARHYEALCALDPSAPATEPGQQARTNAALMHNVETAMVCIQSLAIGAESELTTLALIVREHIVPGDREAFDAAYAKAPIVMGQQVEVHRGGVYAVAQRLCNRLGIEADCGDLMEALGDVEDCRPIALEPDGRVVIWLTEDASPHALFARAHAAAESAIALRATIEKVVAQRDRWRDTLAAVELAAEPQTASTPEPESAPAHEPEAPSKPARSHHKRHP